MVCGSAEMESSRRNAGNGSVLIDIDASQSHGTGSTETSTVSVINEELVSRSRVAENFAKKTRKKSTESDDNCSKKSEEDKDDNADNEYKDDKIDRDDVDGPNKKKYMYQDNEDVPGMTDIDATEEQALKKPSNGYAAKKTVAQGMMDIALITANANQLRYMVEFNKLSPTYYFTLIMISVSLVLQVVIGMALIIKGRLDVRGKSKNTLAKTINNYVIIGVFLVTIINVFIASFTVTASGNVGSRVTTSPTVGL